MATVDPSVGAVKRGRGEIDANGDKRAKSDAPVMRTGDWFCPSCGNHNFASRTTCRKCQTAKPNGPAFGGQGGQGGQGFEMYSPYGMAAVPGMGPMVANANAPVYGFMQQQGGGVPFDTSRPTDRAGDWNCFSCGMHNFASRTSCRKCGTLKVGPEATMMGGRPNRPGDWACPSCDTHNFASRTDCRNCNAPKPTGAPATGGAAAQQGTVPGLENVPNARAGDWLCSSCNAHNYAGRTNCFKCKTAKQ